MNSIGDRSGRLPAHWNSKRLKYVASINDEALPETTPPEVALEYVDIGNVDVAQGILGTEQLTFDTAPSRARRRVKDGDTIVSTVRTYLRAIAPIRNPARNLIVSTGFAVVRPRKVDPDFLSYALRESSFVENVVGRSVGVSYPAINASEVGSIPIPLPPPNEQRAIADFLDRETARLDTLVGKKRELIEKLKEKRTALISRTVTRGLNPRVKLKPSGIEWLGDIPEHWDLKRLKFDVSKIEQGWSPLCDNTPADDDEWGVLKAGAVNGSTFDALENKRLPETENPLPEYEVKKGDLLISRANTRELLGSAALVRSIRPKLLLCDKLYRVKLRAAHFNSEYLLRFLRSRPGHFEFERDATGASASMQNIGQDSVRNLWITEPPIPEQRAIADYLDRETAKIDKMMEKVEAAIEKLQEYRTALITAAVTGKIDVRNGRT